MLNEAAAVNFSDDWGLARALSALMLRRRAFAIVDAGFPSAARGSRTFIYLFIMKIVQNSTN
jgi:hypothetical protein